MEEVEVLKDLYAKKFRRNKNATLLGYLLISGFFASLFIPAINELGPLSFGLFLFILGLQRLSLGHFQNRETTKEIEMLNSLDKRLENLESQ